MNDKTIFKSIDNLTEVIENTSAGDLLLFMIALNKSKCIPAEEIVIGFND